MMLQYILGTQNSSDEIQISVPETKLSFISAHYVIKLNFLIVNRMSVVLFQAIDKYI